MNALFFACCDCKVYVGAGDRWAYWTLEEQGAVVRGSRTYPDAVLCEDGYWNPPKEEDNRWLYESVLPGVRRFLNDHRSHYLVFGQEEDFAPGEDSYLDWMQTGYLAQLTPRYLVEVLGLTSWSEVRSYIEREEIPPAWWEIRNCGSPPPIEKARNRFEELVNKKQVKEGS